MDNDLLWYYGDEQAAFNAAKEAQNLYNSLDSKEISFNNDLDWDNIDLVKVSYLIKMMIYTPI